ncbi:MAG: DsbA family protein [Chloroflexi bacterium]|nr:MAG: DsbA family protein [Chloroflexota bacterium]MBL1194466.1 DsbA family protein [Chloroflexota bacterium]NOH11754.1 DsbA family protein [Chloroflexota bacterium]
MAEEDIQEQEIEIEEEIEDQVEDGEELEEEEETITITLKRSTFFAILIPIAFIVGLGSGYLLWGRGGSATTTTTTTDGSAPVEAADQTLPRYDIPITDEDPAIGPEDAPVTVIEFSDFECPFCRRHTLETAPQILSQYEGQIRYIFKDFPLRSIHPQADPAAEAAHCAREQGEFWAYHDLLFELSLPLGSETYIQYAEDLGLNMSQFTECVENRKYADNVQANFDFAAQLGVRSTPTFFINGIAVVGAQPFATFQEVIDGELNGTNQ